jgi:RNA polymerase sigma-70 factor (ECF subfamily)
MADSREIGSIQEDSNLVGRCLAGEEGAYGLLLKKYKRPVFSLVCRMVRQREEAEELASEAFFKAFRALASYDPEQPFSSWIFKIASNLSIDWLRKRKLETSSLDEEDSVWEVPDERPTAEDVLEKKQTMQVVEEAIGKLAPDYRVVVLLRHQEERSYEEIADILGLPLGTVKIRLFRAREELKKRLGRLVK